MKRFLSFALLLLSFSMARAQGGSCYATYFSDADADSFGASDATIPSVLINEGFDNLSTTLSSGWSQQNFSSSIGTTSYFQGDQFVFNAHSGAADTYAAVNYNSGAGLSTLDNWLITPEVSLENGAQFKFWSRTVPFPTYPDRLQVRMSVAGASTNISDFTTLLLDINPTYSSSGYPTEWTEYTATVTGIVTPTTGRFAFRYFVENGGPFGANSDYIGIDDVNYALPSINSILACGGAPAGYVLNNTDCADSNPAVNPSVTEVCNGIDDNCNSIIDDVILAFQPNVFPQDSWNLYAFNSMDYSSNYAGFYNSTGSGFNTTLDWSGDAAPSSAAGWNGCTVDIDNHTYSIKRQGFPTFAGGSTIVLMSWDDDVEIFVNGTSVYTAGCCGNNSLTAAWSGVLDATSTIEVRIKEYGGGSFVSFDVLPTVPGCIASNACNYNASATIDDGSCVYPTLNYFVDFDFDGYGLNDMWGMPNSFCTDPGLGWSLNNSDCDDYNDLIFPGATELCNGLDDDCSGIADDGLTFNEYFADADGDSFGVPALNYVVTPITYQLLTPQVLPSNVTLDLAGRIMSYTGISINGASNTEVVAAGSTVSLAYNLAVTWGPDLYCAGCITQSYIGIGGSTTTLQCEDGIYDGYTNSYNSGTFIAPTTPGTYYIVQNGSLDFVCQPQTYANTSANAIAILQVEGSLPAVTNPGPNCDDCTSQIPIGFSFPFYGNTYSDLAISSNGFVSFDLGVPNGCCFGNVVPGADAVNNMIALGWYDLLPNNGQVTYFNLSNPNRLVIQYSNAPEFSGSGSLTGQIVMFESGLVQLIYSNLTTQTHEATAGLENATGTVGVTISGLNAQIGSLSNVAYEFVYMPSTLNSGISSCTPLVGYALNNTDCLDNNPAINPGATEVCNGIDDNCDTQIDEGLTFTDYFADLDLDGYGAGAATNACAQPTGFVTTNTDCDDNNASANPAATEICNTIDDNCDGQIDEGVQNTYYEDMDGDGYGSMSFWSIQACSAPFGFVSTNNDCADNNPAINPGAAEACNTIDDNCDGQINEGFGPLTLYYADADGDGYGNGTQAIDVLLQGSSSASVSNGSLIIVGSNSSTNSSLTGSVSFVAPVDATYTFDWSYSTVDSGPNWDPAYYINGTAYPLTDDFGPQTQSGTQSVTVTAGSTFGFSVVTVDDVAGSATLTINNFNGFTLPTFTQACSQPAGYAVVNGDCDDAVAAINPGATEVCNGIDDNCSGVAEEGLTFTDYYADLDLDGYGAGAATNACAQPIGFVTTNTDCDDNNASANPAATEICNEVDDNCDGQIDEGVQNTYYEDMDGDGYGSMSFWSIQACSAPFGFVSSNNDCADNNPAINPGAAEVCNTIDDNCDGQINEGFGPLTLYYADADGDGYGNGTQAINLLLQGSSSASVSNGSLIILGSNSSTNSSLTGSVSFVAPVDATYTFDWSYSTIDGPFYDPAYYINGTAYPLTDNNGPQTQSGTQSVTVTAGSTFGFSVVTTDDVAGSATLTINNFNGFTLPTFTQACSQPAGYAVVNGDCDDAIAAINPGATEVCNGIDDNCSGVADEGLTFTNYYADVDGDGYGAGAATNACAQPTGFVTTNTDCNNTNAAVNPGATELCTTSVDDNCNGVINEGCVTAGEDPSNATSITPSLWPACTAVSGTLVGASASTSAQTICLTGEDRWHQFVATSEGASIVVNSTSADIVIELQTAAGLLVAQENAVSGLGGETLNHYGLTAGQVYKIGVRNYNSALGTGTYSICAKMLKRGGCDYGPGPYTLCQYFKATWAGATGTSYTYTFTGVSGPASGNVYTRTQNSDICVLSSVLPTLPYGSTYNVLITNTYTINNGAGVAETISVPGLAPCTMSTATQPVTALRVSNQCAAGPRFRGAVVASLPWVCGATNWRWEFTELDAFGNPVGLPITVNRGAASNYITLSTVAQLQYGKTYNVRTAPILSYTGTNYQWGTTACMSIVGTAGMIAEGGSESESSTKVEIANEVNMSLYPNPTHGTDVNINLSGVTSDNVQIRVVDAMGRQVWSNRYSVDGILNTNITFEQPLANGLYFVEAIYNGELQTQRMMVQK